MGINSSTEERPNVDGVDIEEDQAPKKNKKKRKTMAVPNKLPPDEEKKEEEAEVLLSDVYSNNSKEGSRGSDYMMDEQKQQNAAKALLQKEAEEKKEKRDNEIFTSINGQLQVIALVSSLMSGWGVSIYSSINSLESMCDWIDATYVIMTVWLSLGFYFVAVLSAVILLVDLDGVPREMMTNHLARCALAYSAPGAQMRKMFLKLSFSSLPLIENRQTFSIKFLIP